MMTVNTQHPEYDLAKELLATLPLESPSSAGASLKELSQDLGVSTTECLSQLRELKKRGYEVAYPASGRGPHAYIKANGWMRATDHAHAYWDRVYGNA